MSNISPFAPQGNQVGFLASTIAPAAVAMPTIGTAAGCQGVFSNNGAVIVYMVWGATPQAASINASIVQNASPIGTGAPCVPIFPLNQISLTLPCGSFVTGVTPSTIAQCYAIPGEGA